jgi:hypothetical protein
MQYHVHFAASLGDPLGPGRGFRPGIDAVVECLSDGAARATTMSAAAGEACPLALSLSLS